jgi:hypothetical protein
MKDLKQMITDAIVLRDDYQAERVYKIGFLAFSVPESKKK